LPCKHKPDRHEHPLRYVGWYSKRVRGERAKAFKAQDPHFGEHRLDESIVLTDLPLFRELFALRKRTISLYLRRCCDDDIHMET
jgi:hypothetical protein